MKKNTVRPGELIIIELFGQIPSKKNRYTPRKDGKGMFKNSNLQTELDRLAMQIPGWARDFNLVSPDIQFQFYVRNGRSDRDSAVTTILDLLVEYGVLKNDTIASCNGTMTTHPAILADEWRTVVTLKP
jgi:hypothetical protein